MVDESVESEPSGKYVGWKTTKKCTVELKRNVGLVDYLFSVGLSHVICSTFIVIWSNVNIQKKDQCSLKFYTQTSQRAVLSRHNTWGKMS